MRVFKVTDSLSTRSALIASFVFNAAFVAFFVYFQLQDSRGWEEIDITDPSFPSAGNAGSGAGGGSFLRCFRSRCKDIFQTSSPTLTDEVQISGILGTVPAINDIDVNDKMIHFAMTALQNVDELIVDSNISTPDGLMHTIPFASTEVKNLLADRSNFIVLEPDRVRELVAPIGNFSVRFYHILPDRTRVEISYAIFDASIPVDCKRTFNVFFYTGVYADIDELRANYPTMEDILRALSLYSSPNLCFVPPDVVDIFGSVSGMVAFIELLVLVVLIWTKDILQTFTTRCKENYPCCNRTHVSNNINDDDKFIDDDLEGNDTNDEKKEENDDVNASLVNEVDVGSEQFKSETGVNKAILTLVKWTKALFVWLIFAFFLIFASLARAQKQARGEAFYSDYLYSSNPWFTLYNMKNAQVCDPIDAVFFNKEPYTCHY